MLKTPALEALKQVSCFYMTKSITEYITDFSSCLAANILLKMVSGNKANNSSNYDKHGNSDKKPEVSPPSNPAGSVYKVDVR
jgi:hypothetical protein